MIALSIIDGFSRVSLEQFHMIFISSKNEGEYNNDELTMYIEFDSRHIRLMPVLSIISLSLKTTMIRSECLSVTAPYITASLLTSKYIFVFESKLLISKLFWMLKSELTEIID